MMAANIGISIKHSLQCNLRLCLCFYLECSCSNILLFLCSCLFDFLFLILCYYYDFFVWFLIHFLHFKYNLFVFFILCFVQKSIFTVQQQPQPPRSYCTSCVWCPRSRIAPPIKLHNVVLCLWALRVQRVRRRVVSRWTATVLRSVAVLETIPVCPPCPRTFPPNWSTNWRQPQELTVMMRWGRRKN